MRKVLFLSAILLLSGCRSRINRKEKFSDPLASAEQIILVTTRNWETKNGFAHYFERENSRTRWRETGNGFPVVIGRNGLGWGNGIHPRETIRGPIKKEGDGKSPAGIFRLSSAFGESEKISGLKLPYRQLISAIECVDDVKSAHYNSIVNREEIAKPDWQSSEKMREIGECYRLGIVVDHNVAPREVGGGSCIFLHIWQTPETGTSGCTAMAQENMEKLLSYLDPKKNPALVQLPETEYRQLRRKWNLP